MNAQHRTEIAYEFEQCIANTLGRLAQEDTHRPFHQALLSPEALFWSRLERSFSTSFGQRVIQKISEIVVKSSGAHEAAILRATQINLTDAQMAAIEHHIGLLRENALGRVPRWENDLRDVEAAAAAGAVGPTRPRRVISDLWFRRGDKNTYISIKTVKPNIDQTAEAKRDLLKLKLADPTCDVYFGLYYNPYGENRADYSWGPPRGIFSLVADPVVLIGRDYWDTLGGAGTYNTVLNIAQQVGIQTRPRIVEYGQRPR